MILLIGLGLGLVVVVLSFYFNAKKAKAVIKEAVKPTLEITEDNIDDVVETQMIHAMGGGPAHPAYVSRTKGVKYAPHSIRGTLSAQVNIGPPR